MSRPADEQRPRELCDATVRYLIEHGLGDLSLRPLARAIGSSPRGLLYHFGSKEKMVVEVIAEIRRRQRICLDGIEGATLSETYRRIWQQISSDSSEPLFRVFFEAYGMALRNTTLYYDFLHDTIEDWLRLIAEPLIQQGTNHEDARAFATLILATLRGFMLDYCTTRDRERIGRAVSLWTASLETMLPARKMD